MSEVNPQNNEMSPLWDVTQKRNFIFNCQDCLDGNMKGMKQFTNELKKFWEEANEIY